MNGPWKVFFEEAGNPDASFELIKRISNECSKVVWYRHPNGKKGKGPHYHGLVFDFPKCHDTCREWIKEALNISGAGKLGVSDKLPKSMGGKKMTEETTPRYITYMTKGKFDPVYNKGYDSLALAALRNQWVQYGDDDNANDNANANVMVCYVEKENKDKITQYSMARTAHSRYLDEVGPDNIEVSKLVKIVIKVLKENKKLAHKRMVANIVQDVLADVNYDEYVRQILSML